VIHIDWNPIPYLGPVPINWYGITVALGFIVGWLLVRRWAPKFDLAREQVDGLLLWIVVGAVIGARLYYVVQNDPSEYLRAPWRILAIWEGGLAYFGGLFGATLAAFIYTRREQLWFARVADLFAPAIPIGSAAARLECNRVVNESAPTRT
jgi:phosphatidylglycerol---prolipoprotein diacylglyceryl transferase